MTRLSAPGYDRFKTVVAVVLVIILLLMLLRGCATSVIPSAPPATEPAAAVTGLPPTSAPATPVAPAVTATGSPTPTAAPVTATATEAPTATQAPAATDVNATPSPAATEPPASTPAGATATPAAEAACQALAPARLSVGQKARVIRRLNVRSAASIKAPILKVNPANTQVDVIGGPTCEPVGANAYRWWQIQLADGTQGWSAESPLNSTSYFLEPVQ